MDITEDEELQAKEFLKRAEIKTMKKDLQKLRETDALAEKDKIVKGLPAQAGKTIEEENTLAGEAISRQIEDKKREKERREKVLSKNINEERDAEKQIKSYAEESEKQQIFLFESQRLGLEKQIDILEQEKESALALEKNKISIEKKEQETKLNEIIEKEEKVEKEEEFIGEKEKTSNVPSEKKSLEERRGELETKRQEIEKKRWVVEKEIKEKEEKLVKINADYQKITEEKNKLKEKIKAIDGSLREVYSGIIRRVEDKKRGLLEEQQKKAANIEKLAGERKEKIQREQWTHSTGSGQVPKEKEFLKGASERMKERLAKSAETEEEQRKKFLEDIEKQTIEEQNKNKSNV